jgi:tRNA/rRNA methyltransferase
VGPLDRFAFVLFKPKASGNVGAAARALKNMGLRDMRLVAPASRGGLAGRSMAVHGRDVLDNARVFAELGAAVEDCGLVVGTTCRGGPYRRAAQPIREAADDLIRIGTVNRVAVIFGPEDFGLTNREIKLCQRLVTIPAAPDYPSLNLAQAVMVVAYELMMAAGAAGTEKDAALSAPAMAPAATVDAMLARMTDALLSIGFLSPDNPDHIMFAVRAMLGRSGVTQRECDILNGIASQILWFGSGGHETIASKGRTGRRIR